MGKDARDVAEGGEGPDVVDEAHHVLELILAHRHRRRLRSAHGGIGGGDAVVGRHGGDCRSSARLFVCFAFFLAR